MYLFILFYVLSIRITGEELASCWAAQIQINIGT